MSQRAYIGLAPRTQANSEQHQGYGSVNDAVLLTALANSGMIDHRGGGQQGSGGGGLSYALAQGGLYPDANALFQQYGLQQSLQAPAPAPAPTNGGHAADNLIDGRSPVRAASGARAAMRSTGGEATSSGRQTSAYASRHQAAEQRRRGRINERWVHVTAATGPWADTWLDRGFHCAPYMAKEATLSWTTCSHPTHLHAHTLGHPSLGTLTRARCV